MAQNWKQTRRETFEYFPGDEETTSDQPPPNWFVRWRAKNGEIRMVSERFPTKAHAKRAADRMASLVASAKSIMVDE